MRFPDLLRTTVILCGAAATLLAVVTVAGANQHGDAVLVTFAAGWWVLAAVSGGYIGRRQTTSRQIAVLLASARTQTSLPEINPSRVVLNRLWPIILCTVGAGGVGFALPQVPAIACGFAIIWALAWRRQSAAVTAIEERDGVRFYVEHTSPVQPLRLVRTPGFRTNLSEMKRSERSTPVTGRHA
ncbi:MAG: hypothetical protein FWD04_06270 [Conexibacteraceae bacterium]|nr:hypothetical protein [Conexibacteraceae bacterium]